jgi:hypothetical protein
MVDVVAILFPVQIHSIMIKKVYKVKKLTMLSNTQVISF